MKNKILAVDDSRMMLRIICGSIEMLDYEPLKASNGREAPSGSWFRVDIVFRTSKPMNAQPSRVDSTRSTPPARTRLSLPLRRRWRR